MRHFRAASYHAISHVPRSTFMSHHQCSGSSVKLCSKYELEYGHVWSRPVDRRGRGNRGGTVTPYTLISTTMKYESLVPSMQACFTMMNRGKRRRRDSIQIVRCSTGSEKAKKLEVESHVTDIPSSVQQSSASGTAWWAAGGDRGEQATAMAILAWRHQ